MTKDKEPKIIFPELEPSMLSISKVKNYDFDGEILGMDIQGSFSIQWDNDIAEVSIDSIYEQESLKFFEIADEGNVFELIAEEILHNHNDEQAWAEDRASAMIDHAYDTMREER